MTARPTRSATPSSPSPVSDERRAGGKGLSFARLDSTTACPVCRDPAVAPGETAVQIPDTTPRKSDSDRETLSQQVRALQQRLAFYEGFDRLIQDNVAHARELFRLAAQEREAATTAIDQARQDAGRREAHLRVEIEQIASDLRQLSQLAGALSDRVARAVGEPAMQNGW